MKNNSAQWVLSHRMSCTPRTHTLILICAIHLYLSICPIVCHHQLYCDLFTFSLYMVSTSFSLIDKFISMQRFSQLHGLLCLRIGMQTWLKTAENRTISIEMGDKTPVNRRISFDFAFLSLNSHGTKCSRIQWQWAQFLFCFDGV